MNKTQLRMNLASRHISYFSAHTLFFYGKTIPLFLYEIYIYEEQGSIIHGNDGGYRWIVELYWNDFEFHIWLLFLLTPFIRCLLFSVWSCQRIKNGRKETRIPLNSNFILWLMTILWYCMFSWPCRNSHVSRTKHWNVLVIFGELYVWSS